MYYMSVDDFEVSIFLTDPSTRHSLLLKHKDFKHKRGKIESNSGRLTGWLTGGQDRPIELAEDEDGEADVVIREESDDESNNALQKYPEARQPVSLGTKRGRHGADEELNVPEEVSEDEGFQTQQSPATKKARAEAEEAEDDADDKKKMGLATSYEGFSIYGRVLCLVVKRKGGAGSSKDFRGASSNETSQRMMESWVSTQAAESLQGVEDDY